MSPPDLAERRRYTVVPDQSAILLTVATSLGPVAFGATGLEGFVEVVVLDGEVDPSVSPAAHLEVQVHHLTSGNSAYDRELRRQLNARRFPAAYVDLHHASRASGTARGYRVGGEVMLGGVTEPVEGVVKVVFPEPEVMVVSGEESLDISAFGIPPPTLFMMKIDPEVKLSLQLEARA